MVLQEEFGANPIFSVIAPLIIVNCGISGLLFEKM